MNTPSEPNNYNDEINFGPLINWIKKLIQNLLNNLRRNVSLVKKYHKLTIAGVVLGLLVGISVFFWASPLYKSEMILTSKGYSSLYIQDRIETISELVNKKSSESISALINIDEKQAKQIKSIEFSHLDPDQKASDSVQNNLYFKIIVEVNSTKILRPLNKSILNYLRKNSYANLNSKLQKAKFRKRIKIIEEDIAEIDKLKNKVEKNLGNPEGTENGFVFGEPLNPIDFFNESQRLNEQKLDLEILLQLMENVEIVNNLYVNKHPVFPRFRHILFFTLLGFICAALFILFWKKE